MTRLFVTVFLAAAVAGAGASAGEVYEHFREHPVDFSEQDLHLLADAFYISAHYSADQKADLFSGIQNSLVNATNQTGEIGRLIDSTQGLIKVVKDAAGQLTNPGNLVSSALKSGWTKLFGRLLQNADKENVAKFVDNLELKVSEAKSQQQTITNALSNSSKFLGVLQGVGQLLSGNSAGFKSTISQYFPSWLGGNHLSASAQAQDSSLLQRPRLLAGSERSQGDRSAHLHAVHQLSNLFQASAAHLEVLAQKPDTSYGRHRKSLFQQEEAKRRLTSMANSLKQSARYLNSVDDSSVNFGRLENHLWDLVQDGGLTGKAYLRGVETLKCILLKTGCPEVKVIPSGYTKTVYFGQNTAAESKALNGFVAGSEAQAQANQVVNTGTDVRVQAVPLNSDGSVNTVQQTVNVQPGFLSGSSWGYDASAQNNGFNPSQGNEAIIVNNESPVSQLPPVSDVVSGVQYTTLLNQQAANLANNDFLIPNSGEPQVLSVPQSGFTTVSTGDNAQTVTVDDGVIGGNQSSSVSVSGSTVQYQPPVVEVTSKVTSENLNTVDAVSDKLSNTIQNLASENLTGVAAVDQQTAWNEPEPTPAA